MFLWRYRIFRFPEYTIDFKKSDRERPLALKEPKVTLSALCEFRYYSILRLQRKSGLKCRIAASKMVAGRRLLAESAYSSSTASLSCSEFTSIYLWVVEICECPANSASKRTPTPLLASRVMYVRLPEWLDASLSPTAL